MALSRAEKQRRYRERHLGDGEKQRIQCVVSLCTKLKLKRLAHYYGCSLTTLIENLAADTEGLIVRSDRFSRCWRLLQRQAAVHLPASLRGVHLTKRVLSLTALSGTRRLYRNRLDRLRRFVLEPARQSG
jgi:hypothetical protein